MLVPKAIKTAAVKSLLSRYTAYGIPLALLGGWMRFSLLDCSSPFCLLLIEYLYFFQHVERMDIYRMARRVLMAEVSGGLVRGRPRLG